MSKNSKLYLMFSSLWLGAACSTYYVIPADPNDPDPVTAPTATAMATAMPTAAAGPAATPGPTMSPGWVTVLLSGHVSTFAMLDAEVRRLHSLGLVSDVFQDGAQIRLSGSGETIAHLQELAAADNVPFTTLLQRGLSASSAFARLISNEPEFVAFWRLNVIQLDDVPAIDFTAQAVVAVFGPPEPTTGYTLQIETVRLSGKHLTIRYRIVAPVENGVPSHFTPVHVVVIPLSQARGDFDQISFEVAS